MSKVSIQGDASGTGTLTIAAPNTNSNYTLTLPTNTGTVMTSASDTFAGGLTLGGDLTLDSNGIYLGGTGAANYLDDYETGTWTPEFEPESGSFSSITYSSTQQIGRYIKVGKQVTCLLQTNTSSISLGTAAVGLKIIGLPFTPTSGSAQGSGFCNVFQNWGTTPDPIGLFVSSTSAVLYLRYGNNQKILPSTLRTTNDSNQMWAVITYTTA
jgi:hypothetical protein